MKRKLQKFQQKRPIADGQAGDGSGDAAQASQAHLDDLSSCFPDGLAVLNREATGADLALALVQPPFPAGVACPRLDEPLVQQATRSGSVPDVADYPINSTVLQQRVTAKDYSLKKDTADFAAKASQIAHSPVMPTRVQRPKVCGPLCAAVHTVRALSLHRRTVDMLVKLVSGFSKKMSSIGHQELIFAILSSQGADTCAVEYFAAASASGRQAHHPAQANFVRLALSDATVPATWAEQWDSVGHTGHTGFGSCFKHF